MPAGYPTPRETREVIRRMAAEGKSTREIARAVGMHQPSLWRLGVVKMGLTFHGKPGGHNRKATP